MLIRPSRTEAAPPGVGRADVLGADAELEPAPGRRGGRRVRAAMALGRPTLSRARPTLGSSETVAGTKFIVGEPMKEATNLFSGRW